jgi:hypothetical protein
MSRDIYMCHGQLRMAYNYHRGYSPVWDATITWAMAMRGSSVPREVEPTRAPTSTWAM